MRPGELSLWQRADALLAELLELPPEERPAALARATSGVADGRELAHAVAQLLAAAEKTGGPLDSPIDIASVAHEPEPRSEQAPLSLTGRRLGAYLLDAELGRGGMAVVYRGHRADGAFAQEVAIKVLGVGLLSLGAGDRFRREQQVLARLRHPHIATMLDGGVAADGTPYLVMERIDGRPIDRYSAEERLAPRARVALLMQVCEAVAFAHRNLVVHRDLKPTNILVDGEGQVKLLDFGIAKLLEPEADEPQLTVGPARFLTPGYAAPEQVDGGAVTTATDVFALGRVLDRLLATPPAANDPDLANIARQAMRAEPERRYGDAAALAADLERWQTGRPVQATGDSRLYRLGKLLRRHRAAVAAGALVLAVATAGLVTTLWQAARARQEERTAAVVNSFLVDLFHASDPERAQGEDPRASELLRRGAARARAQLAGEPRLESQLLHVIGSIQREVGESRAAEESLGRALELRIRHLAAFDPAIAATQIELGLTRYELGRVDEAVALLRAALADLERTQPPGALARLEAEVGLGDMLVVSGDYSEARARMESVLARLSLEASESSASDPAREARIELALDAEYTLGVALGELGEVPAAAGHLARVVDEERRRSGGFSSDLALYLNEAGMLDHDRADYAAAEGAYREALAIKRRLYGDAHPQVASGLLNLGMALQDLARPQEALAMLEEALAVSRKIHGDRHPEVAMALTSVAVALADQARPQEAEQRYVEAVAIWRGLPAGSFEADQFANCLRNYGTLLLRIGEPARAEAILRETVARYEALELVDPVRSALAGARHGEALVATGRAAQGVALISEALTVLADTHYGWERPGFVELQLALVRGELALGRHDRARALLGEVRSRIESAPAAAGAEWEPVRGAVRELANQV
ncbi:MAG: serine/threonine protein kinase [Thermoanaerobaculia bacterium]|nr:serine/threonine protein kinase [Thermoanaerobaculia bacterium]